MLKQHSLAPQASDNREYREHRVHSMSPRRRSRRAGSMLAQILLALLAGCGSNGVGTGGHASLGQTTRQAPSSATPHDGVQRPLSAHFALLRNAADGMPSKVESILRREPLPGMEWSQSRRLPVSLPGSYWLVPGTQAVCIVARPPASSSIGVVCAPIRQALRHGIADTSLNFSPAVRTIVGVAPDGVRGVSVHCPKSTTTLRVGHYGLFTLRDSMLEGPERFGLHYR